MKEKIEKCEKWILRNLTIIAWWIIIIILLLLFIKTIDLQFTLTSIWAIFVFWYWYKTYERDKELEIIEKYTEKYNLIFSKIRVLDWKGEKNLIEFEYIYSDLINLWYEEYYLFQKLYITDHLWSDWEYWIYRDLVELINFEPKLYNTHDNLTPFMKTLVQYYQKKEFAKEKSEDKFSVYILEKTYNLLVWYIWLRKKLYNNKIISKVEYEKNILWFNSLPEFLIKDNLPPN